MAIYLKQSTASQEVPLGYFVDSTDGNTEETGLTIANTDIKIWKAGATTLANKNSGGATHISNGIYYAVLDATDTDTLGPMVIFVHVSGALSVRLECMIVTANIFDTLFSTDKLEVDLTQIGGSSVSTTTAQLGVNIVQISGDGTAADNLESYCDGTTPIPSNATQISGDATAADNLEAACDGTTYNLGGGAIVAASVTGAAGSVTGAVGSVTAGVTLASGAITAAVIATDAIDADALKSDAIAEIADQVWDEILSGHAGVGSTGAALSAAGGSGDPWATALPGAYGEGTAGKILGDNLNAPVGTIDTVVDAIKAKTDNLPASPAAVGSQMDLVAAPNATAVTAIQNGLATSTQIGTAGANLTAIPWNAAWDAEVQSECTDALNAYDPPTKSEMDTGLDALPTAAEIKTAMEGAGGHLALILEDTGTTLDGLIDDIKALVGNYAISSPVFDENGNLTSATITANGKTFTVTATYDGDTNLATYSITEG